MGEGGDEAVHHLRARGKRLTPQRLLVLEALRSLAGHVTADAVFEAVTACYPYINRATIYRTLTWLKDQGLASATDLGTGAVAFEYLGEPRHHHLVCLHCGGQQEFSDDLAAPFAAALQARYQFIPRLDHLAIFGICRGCQDHAVADLAPGDDT